VTAAGVDALLVPAQHDYRFVLLSVLISILGAYAARELTDRVRGTRGRSWIGWCVGASLMDALGTWSMHYTAKLALILPVPLVLDWRIVVLSYLVCVAGSGGALLVLRPGNVTWSRAALASVLLGGVGISGLHFTAMGGVMQPGAHHYFSPMVIASIGVAVLFAFLAISVHFIIADENRRGLIRNDGGAVLRGLANPLMHYTAMAGVTFGVVGNSGPLPHGVSISTLGLIGVSLVPIAALLVCLLTIFVDRQQRQRALFTQLFEQAPQPVALVTLDHRIVRVNREFSRVFGYSRDESTGRLLEDLIVPPGHETDVRDVANLPVTRGRVDVETVRRRKDGSLLDVELTRVPVSLPAGDKLIYGVYRDVTERNAAERALRASERALLDLLDERQRLAEDLHDHIVQAIYALGMRLERVRRKSPAELDDELKQIVAGLNEVIRDARQYISGSRMPALTTSRFRRELDKIIEASTGDTRFDIAVDPSALESLSDNDRQHLLHAAREALSNTIRHAGARNASVTVDQTSDAVRMEIADDGVGFDASGRADRRRGLQNMASRARQMGARLDIRSAPDQGTRVTLTLPKAPIPPTADD
jgi:PAS domain S-box-containing protein